MKNNQEPQDDTKSLALMALATKLLAKRDEAVKFRAASGIEQEWRTAQDLYEGREDGDQRASTLAAATGEYVRRESSQEPRSRVVVNITKARVDTAVGRFVDIVTPTDRANWDMEPTPVPELAEMLSDKRVAVQEGQTVTKDDGSPATMADIARDVREEAERRMVGMKAVISDQLAECSFVHEQRKQIFDAAKLGTGVIKGPVARKDYKKSWSNANGVYAMVVEEDIVPRSYRVSPWNVYPSQDCGDDIKKASYVWERDEILPRDVQGLMGLPGYFEDQLAMVLEEEPGRTSAETDKENRWQVAKNSIGKGCSYEIWEYYGEVSGEELAALGCECSGKSVSACATFINDRPVRVRLNILDSGEHPFDFFTWKRVDGRPWGEGIPIEMQHLQKIITAGWRAMLDNARDSAGASVIVGSEVEPVNGQWMITGKSLWRATEKDIDVGKQFAQFQLASNQADLQGIIDMALKFVDLVTGIPTIFQGEAQEVPETLGQTNIMVDSANIGIRMRVKIFDDDVTKPHIRRYYDYNMQYHQDDSIKGDYKVVPIGLSALYEADQQSQLLLQTFQLKQDPDVAKEVDWKKAVRQFFQMKKLDILKSDAELAQQEEQQQPQAPPDPRMAVAQIRSETEMQKAQLNQQSDMAELQFKAAEAEKDRQHDMQMKMLEREIAMMKLATEQQISLDSIKATLSGKAMELNLQKELAAKDPIPPQVARPEFEPTGQAPAGQAFQR